MENDFTKLTNLTGTSSLKKKGFKKIRRSFQKGRKESSSNSTSSAWYVDTELRKVEHFERVSVVFVHYMYQVNQVNASLYDALSVPDVGDYKLKHLNVGCSTKNLVGRPYRNNITNKYYISDDPIEKVQSCKYLSIYICVGIKQSIWLLGKQTDPSLLRLIAKKLF